MGRDVAAESTDDAVDAATDPAECSVPAAVDCGYATRSRRPSAATPTTNHWDPAFREFNRNHPPEFNGEGEPQEAKRWVKHMEKIFRMADCTEEDKVIFATNQFRGAAEDWWETAQRRMVANGIEVNWENFKQVMLEKYLSCHTKSGKSKNSFS